LVSGLIPASGPGYTLETLTFTTSGPSSQDLTFETTQVADDRTFFVDAVSLSATPEPGYLGVLVAGMIGLIALKKYRAGLL
jgi:hypothetical protein